jgi:hypothetical protein
VSREKLSVSGTLPKYEDWAFPRDGVASGEDGVEKSLLFEEVLVEAGGRRTDGPASLRPGI